MEANVQSTPFSNLKIKDFKPLQDLKRSPCPKCKAKRMYFCYTCYKFVEDIDSKKMPNIKLPIPCDVIKHPKELDGKSTAVHAAIIAPDDVHIYTYPVIPDYSKNEDVLLVFPGPDAHSLQYYSKCKSTATNVGRKRSLDELYDKGAINCNDKKIIEPTFKRIVLIDSTWNQVHGISSDKRLKGVNCVELTEQSTNYWRRQHSRPDNHLATIEAIHSFYRQYHEMFIGNYRGQYDDLLYFFVFFHQMVHKNKEMKKRF